MKEAEQRLPKMQEITSARLRFSKVPDDLFPIGSNSAQITKHSIDMSYRLEQMLDRQKQEFDLTDANPFNLLGELQFAFTCFLIGQVYDAFEQWKILIGLLCNSESLVEKYLDMFTQLIQVLYFQIKELPEDFFTDIITSNNFLIVNLHNFFDNIKELNRASANLKFRKLNEKCARFKSYLQEKFQFDFDTEPEEYAPVVVGHE